MILKNAGGFQVRMTWENISSFSQFAGFTTVNARNRAWKNHAAAVVANLGNIRHTCGYCGPGNHDFLFVTILSIQTIRKKCWHGIGTKRV